MPMSKRYQIHVFFFISNQGQSLEVMLLKKIVNFTTAVA